MNGDKSLNDLQLQHLIMMWYTRYSCGNNKSDNYNSNNI